MFSRRQRVLRPPDPVRAVVVACVAVGIVFIPAAASAPPTGPAVWFAPLPRLGTAPYTGSSDFAQLFDRKAWPNAARHVAVFKFYSQWVVYNTTQRQLRRAVAELKRRKISIAVETGPLRPVGACGPGEGFAGGEGVAAALRIKSVGGVLRYIAFDEPFFYATLYSGEKACHWDARRVADGVAAFIREMREVFPKVQFGDIEPLTTPAHVRQFEEWVDTYREVTGKSLAFLHLDTWYSLPTWPQLARELEDFAHSRGVLFGVIYNGDGDDTSDAEWLANAQQRFELYETEGAGHPDQTVLQSWTDKPDRVLPETRRTFTNLILRYVRPRTRLELEPRTDVVAGTLLANGPLANQPIRMSVERTYADSAYSRSVAIASATTATGADGRFRAALPVSTATAAVVRYPGSARYWPAYAGAGGEKLRNVARGRPATGSAEQPATPARYAVDGDPNTAWIAGQFPSQWIDIDLGAPTAVAAIRLGVAQTPREGETTHAVLGRPADGPFRELYVFSGRTTDGEVLEQVPSSPWQGIRYLRVETRASPSWVAWREIEIFQREP